MSFSLFFQALVSANKIECTTVDLLGQERQVPGIPLSSTIKLRLLRDDEGFVLVMYPASHSFDLQKLLKATHRKLVPLHGERLTEAFSTLLADSLTTLNQENNLHVFMDDVLSEQDHLYLCAADMGKGLICEVGDIQKLCSDEVIGLSISEPSVSPSDSTVELPVVSMRERLKKLYDLPPMPETASRIMELRAKPDFTTEELAKVVEQDPALAAQVVRYANSALFGQNGNIASIKDAIFRVLGVNAVMDLAFGLSLGKRFKLPKSGPLGGERLWKEATYTAALMQKLALLMPWGTRLDFGTAYLVGLLHNFGVLVLAHLFPQDFEHLNDEVAQQPDVPLAVLERKSMGITHTEAGGLVMRAWGLPEALVVATREHHNPDYEGEFLAYLNLLLISQRVLTTHGLSNSDSDELPMELLDEMGLKEEDVIIAADEIIQERDLLNAMALQLCA